MLYGGGPERGLPPTLTAAGRTRSITHHLQQQSLIRRELTEERIITVLENWGIRGIGVDRFGRPGMNYLGWVDYEGEARLMRVVVSMDDRRIVTAYLDRPATKRFANEGWNRVADRLKDVEVS